MLFFRNDYGQGCIPEILDLLNKTNYDSHPGYGLDKYCEQAKTLIQANIPDTEVDIQFISGGTLTNLTIIKSILRPYEAVIACDSGHISTHETGSVEATGHKVIELPNSDGKLHASQIEKCYNDHMMTYEHMVYPKLVYISNSTEFGTVYTREELESLRAVCDKLGFYLMMDGARLGAALESGVDYISPVRPFADDDARGMEIVIEGLPFAQEFRRKHDIIRMIARLYLFRVANRDRRLDDHDGFRIDVPHFFDDRFYGRCIEEILLRIIIGRRRNDDKICIRKRFLSVQRRLKMQIRPL